MTAVCTIRLPGAVQGPWNATTGQYTSTPHAPYYTGPCRVQQLHQPNEVSAGEQRVSTHDYLVPVPAAVTAVELGHILTVTAGGPDLDPSLIGRLLTVTDIQRGSLTWERDLTCTDDLG